MIYLVNISEADSVLSCDVVTPGPGESAQDSGQHCPLYLWQDHLWLQQTAEQPHQPRGAPQQVPQQDREGTCPSSRGGGGKFHTGTL